MAKYGPTHLTSQPRGTYLASAHLRDVTVVGKKGRIKLNCTCGSWKKHSKNSEEGLPLAVVRQCVVEHKLFGVADEAVLCKDMEGERRTSETTGTAGDPPACSPRPPVL